MFNIYLQLGLQHIADLQAYDHILFIVALCAPYRLKDWRQLVVLVTAFTVGHSVTLALSALNVLNLPPDFIEMLIPITIVLTAFFNIWQTQRQTDILKTIQWHYLLALIFGFVHGMGFSNYFKALLGHENDILLPLFSFNIGVEIGQLLIVAGTLLLSFIIVDCAKLRYKYWIWGISGLIAIFATRLLFLTFS